MLGVYCLFLDQWGMAKFSVYTVSFLQWGLAKCLVYTVSYNEVWQNVKYILSLSCPVGYRYGKMFSRLSVSYNGIWQNVQHTLSLFSPAGYGKIFSIRFLFLVHWGMAKSSVYSFSFLSIGVWQIFSVHFLFLVQWGMAKCFSISQIICVCT